MKSNSGKPDANEFPGAMAALRWLADEGFEAPLGPMSGRFLKGDLTAYVVDGVGKTAVVVGAADSGLHAPTVCERTGQPRYSFKNWISDYACPACGKRKAQNKNFLGSDELVCVGEGKFRRRRT